MLEVWGGQRKTRNRAKNAAKNKIFLPLFFAEFFRAFSVCVFFRSVSGKRRRKKVSQNFNIKIQHGMMIQSRMLTRWSSKPNQCAHGSSKQDLEKRIFLQLAALHRSSHQLFKSPLIGEIQKGTAGRGREKKCHDNLRQTSRQFTTCHDNLRHFMTISVSLFH